MFCWITLAKLPGHRVTRHTNVNDYTTDPPHYDTSPIISAPPSLAPSPHLPSPLSESTDCRSSNHRPSLRIPRLASQKQATPRRVAPGWVGTRHHRSPAVELRQKTNLFDHRDANYGRVGNALPTSTKSRESPRLPHHRARSIPSSGEITSRAGVGITETTASTNNHVGT